MHEIVNLRPEVDNPPTPQCSARPESIYTVFATWSGYIANRAERLRRKGYDPERCAHSSSFTIDGRPYCKLHFRIAAAALIKGD